MPTSQEETFESIYLSCFSKLVIYLHQYTQNRHDAEDIASQAMLILMRKWDSLPSHTQKGIFCWLVSTAHNLWMEEIKRRAQAPATVSLENLPPALHPASPHDMTPKQKEEEYRQCLQELSEQLPETEAALLHDKIVKQMSNEEIAARLAGAEYGSETIAAALEEVRETRSRFHTVTAAQEKRREQSE